MKKTLIIVFALMLGFFCTAKSALDIDLIYDNTVRLSGASGDSVYVVAPGLLEMEADSLAFVCEYEADSTTFNTARDSVGIVVKLQYVTPNSGPIANGWANYTTVLTHAYNDVDVTEFGSKVTLAITKPLAKVHILVHEVGRTSTQNVRLKVWAFKKRY